MKFIVVLAVALMSFIALAETQVTLYITLTPAGSFNAVNKKVKGNLIKKDGAFTTDKLSLNIENFKTGIDLRDEHLWKHLQASKQPKATLTDLKATAGKGTANLEVAGVKKPINLVYAEKGTEVVAKFQVKASDFALPAAQYLGVGVDDLIKVEAIIPFVNK
jgi:polyisoprenoid-binding protein YceI